MLNFETDVIFIRLRINLIKDCYITFIVSLSHEYKSAQKLIENC